MAQDRWQQLLESVRADDGLPTRDSGAWAERKLWFWNRYIEITTSAMVGKPQWREGLVYVDLFAGPGICTIRSTRQRIPGSPLLAASAPKPFRKILLCDADSRTAQACNQRLKSRLESEAFHVFCGDCNDVIDDIVAMIPKRTLVLALLDPTGLHLKMTTIQALSAHGAVDLLILFPDAVDVMRNRDVYFKQSDSNLDKVLGADSNWRQKKLQLGSSDAAELRRLFVKIYQDQLATHAGFKFFETEVIRGDSGPLYKLVYATKHKTGADFWKKSVAKELRGVRRLPFPE